MAIKIPNPNEEFNPLNTAPEKTIKKETSKEFTISNGERYSIDAFDGETGIDIILRVMDLFKDIMKPDQMTPQAIAQALVSGGGGSAFVVKAKELINDMMLTICHKPKGAKGTPESPAIIRLDEKYRGFHFRQNYPAIIELIVEVVIINDFLDLILMFPGDLVQSLMGMIKPDIKSQKKQRKSGSS